MSSLRPQRVLVALAVIFAVIVIVRSFAPAPPPSSPPSLPPAELTQIAGTVELPEELKFLMAPRAAPTLNPLASWRPVFQQSGVENLQSPTFELNGNTVRVRYSLTGEVSVLAAYLLAAAPTPPPFSFPDVITAGAGSGETYLTRPAGPYYVNIQSVGGAWTMEIEEETLSPPEEPAESVDDS